MCGAGQNLAIASDAKRRTHLRRGKGLRQANLIPRMTSGHGYEDTGPALRNDAVARLQRRIKEAVLIGIGADPIPRAPDTGLR